MNAKDIKGMIEGFLMGIGLAFMIKNVLFGEHPAYFVVGIIMFAIGYLIAWAVEIEDDEKDI